MKCLLGVKCGATVESLKYNTALISSRIDCGCGAYGLAAKSLLKKLPSTCIKSMYWGN